MRFVKKHSVLIFIVSAVSVISATAQTDTIAALMDEVTITAQRKETQQQYLPYSVVSVKRQQLDAYSSRTTPEALFGSAGIFVQKTNHGGGSPFLRGLTGNQTLLLIDGIRLNNSIFRYGPNQYLNTIDPYTINFIEAAKGTGSVQYGTDAMGGVIQVFTNEPQFSLNKPVYNGKLVTKYMTGNMEKTGRGEVELASKKIAFTGGATIRNFGDLTGGDTTGKQTPSGYNETALDGKIKFLLKNNIQLTIAQQFLRQRHVPVFHKVRLENFLINEMDIQQRVLSYAKLSIQTDKKIVRRTDIIASHQQAAEGRVSRKNGSSILKKDKDIVNTRGFTINIYSEMNKLWTAGSGIELYKDNITSNSREIDILNNNAENPKRGLYPDGAKYGNSSLYSLHHFNYKKWVVDAGVRLNLFHINIYDSNFGKINIRPEAFVYNAAVMYSADAQNHLYVNFSKGFRAPNIDDMGTVGIVDFRYELPAYNLAPEKSATIEAGYKFSGKKISGSFALYYMRLRQLITRVKEEGQLINGYPVYRKENTDKAFIKGAEAAFEWNPVKALLINGSISSTFGQSITKNEPVRRIPPLNGRLGGFYHKKNFSTSIELLYAAAQRRLAQGDKDDNRIPVGGTPGWYLINLYAGYKFKWVDISTGLQNIFNKDYRTHGSGINGAGRNLFLSAAVRLLPEKNK
jgi:hemoglobin/transferrin/lactoferrin receptor protein